MVLQLEAVEAIVKHAVGEYPEECCGAIVGVLDGDRHHGSWSLADPHRRVRTRAPVR